MSRSGYTYDCENLDLYRRSVANAIRGKRGRAFLQELLSTLDAMPQKRLIAGYLQDEGEVCAIGSVGLKRGVDMSQIDADEPWEVAGKFNIAPCMAQEIAYINDECGGHSETPEHRFERVRAWVVKMLETGDPDGC